MFLEKTGSVLNISYLVGRDNWILQRDLLNVRSLAGNLFYSNGVSLTSDSRKSTEELKLVLHFDLL